jgi:hypothetical protein
MGKMSRDKGARFERQIADYFTQEGYVCHRTAQYCGNTGDAPDVSGLPYIHIECKAYKDTEYDPKWMEQAKRDAHGVNIPVVIHKTDYHKPKATLTGRDLVEMMIEYVTNNPDDIPVTMELDDFTKMYREYEANRYLTERSKDEG